MKLAMKPKKPQKHRAEAASKTGSNPVTSTITKPAEILKIGGFTAFFGGFAFFREASKSHFIALFSTYFGNELTMKFGSVAIRLRTS